MKTFDVHAIDLNVRASRLLEASAGTGKTYAIEHLFTRLVLSDPVIPFDQMALITFTKKATQSIKLRLRNNLSQSIQQLRCGVISTNYLKQAVDNRSHEIILRRLQEALFYFDQLKISTIHSFAGSMLQRLGVQNHSFHELGFEDEFLENLVRLQLQAMDENSIRESKIVQLLKRQYGWHVESLIEDLCRALKTGLEIGERGIQSPNLEHILLWMKQLSHRQLKELLLVEAPAFRELCDKSGKIKYSTLEKSEAWLLCETQESLADVDGIIDLIESFQIDRVKKNYKGPPLRLAEYFLIAKPWICELKRLQVRKKALEELAHYLKKRLAPILETDERLGFDVLLKKLSKHLQIPSNAINLAKTLQVLVVDEFQDTDPLQWEILQTLHRYNPSLTLVLVGDPKQSIYAFRQADIYTYLQARSYIHKIAGDVQVLDTNYRSHPQLVKALNHLFDEKQLKNWLWLPRKQENIQCLPVLAGRPQEAANTRARVQFFDIEGSRQTQLQMLTQVIASSYPYLKAQNMKSFAALVSDHKSSRDLQQLLQAKGIPCQVQKPIPFSQLASTQMYAMIVKAFLDLKDIKAMKSLWSLPFWSLKLDQMDAFFSVQTGARGFWKNAGKMQELLQKKGLGSFHEAWLNFVLPGLSQTVLQYAQSTGNGKKILLQWRSLICWMHQFQPLLTAETPLDVLHQILSGHLDEEALYQESIEDGNLQIITIHVSKGLEYDVVYSFGSATPGRSEKGWIQAFIEGSYSLHRAGDNLSDPSYRQACDESDSEKARRIYVAWTRAREYLFIARPPLGSTPRMLARGRASAMDLYMASYELSSDPCCHTCDYDKLYDLIAAGQFDRFEKHLEDGFQQGLLALWNPQEYLHSAAVEPKSITTEHKPPLFHLDSRPLFTYTPRLESFSSLIQKGSIHMDLPDSFGVDFIKNEIIETAGADKLGSVPKGPEIGTFWHEAIQRALQISKRYKSFEDIQNWLTLWFLKKENNLQPWQLTLIEEACLFIEKAWHIKGTRFRLVDLPSHLLRLEKEFILPNHHTKSLFEEIFSHNNPLVQGCPVQGIMDAWVIVDRSVIFFDWKSNWIGVNHSAYTAANMIKNALAHHYDWQASIYSAALSQYLAQIEGLEFLGGVYTYLRGPSSIFWNNEKKCFEELVQHE